MTENKDINNIVRRLSSRLRVEMNGAVSATMRESGVEYRLNYGVSIPTIKDVAAEYSGNHELALHLYGTQVRELRLSAIFIEDLNLVDRAQMELWRESISSREIAEHLSMVILSHMDFGFDLALEWISDDNKYVSYAAMMTLGRILRQFATQNKPLSQDQQVAILGLVDLVAVKAEAGGMLWHGALTMLVSGARADNTVRSRVEALLLELSTSEQQWLRNLSTEATWQL